jgi:mono/diheme cytochrome c family protein
MGSVEFWLSQIYNRTWRKKVKVLMKWIAIIFAGLFGILAAAVLILYTIGNSRLHNATVPTRPVSVANDPDILARGEYLAKTVSACADCHGENLEGKHFVDEPAIGTIPAPNLTSGIGGIGGRYTVEDWELAIRHGVGADGQVLGGMPSDSFASLSDEDLAAIIAYLQSLPAVDNELPARSLSFIGTILFGVFAYQDLPVAKISHELVGTTQAVEAVSVEYGRYLTDIASCRDCRGADLRGRSAQEAASGPPAGPDLSPNGSLGNWTLEGFISTMRSGITPDGRNLEPQMPWATYGGMSDDELHAIWLYLQDLPASQ